jgi:hypothetical protein
MFFRKIVKIIDKIVGIFEKCIEQGVKRWNSP